MPANPENQEHEARDLTRETVGVFEHVAQDFDRQAWEVLMASPEGGGRRRMQMIEAQLNSIFTGWIAELANTAADAMKSREDVKEETWRALQEMNKNVAASLMRLAEMQTQGENRERTHATYLQLVEEYLEGLRAVNHSNNSNHSEIFQTLRNRGPILQILSRLHNAVDPSQRLRQEDYAGLTDFITSLRTDRNAEASTDPARLFDQSLLGALLTTMSNDEITTLCLTFKSQGHEGEETARYLLLFAVHNGYRPRGMAVNIAQNTHLITGDFSAQITQSETDYKQRHAALVTPEIDSIVQPFFDNVTAHNMSLKKYTFDSTIMYLGAITTVANVFGRIIERFTESSGKPANERIMAIFRGMGDAATDPYAWLGAAAAAYGANAMSDGKLWAGFAAAPNQPTRREQERVDKHARLWDEVHEREDFDTFILKYFNDLYSSAEEQKRATNVSRPRREDIPDLNEEELRAWGFRSQESAKDSIAQTFQILVDDFGNDSEQGLRIFFSELDNIPRPSRLDIPTPQPETETA